MVTKGCGESDGHDNGRLVMYGDGAVRNVTHTEIIRKNEACRVLERNPTTFLYEDLWKFAYYFLTNI